MLPEISKRWKDLEDRRAKFVARVRALPVEKQNQKPTPKLFSAAEVVQHFAQAEDYDLAFLRKTPPSSLASRVAKPTFIFRKTISMMENPVRSVATAPAMVPRGAVDLDKAEKNWDTARQELEKYFDEVTDARAPMVKFNFLFGLVSAADFLSLLESHMHYHEVRFPVKD